MRDVGESRQNRDFDPHSERWFYPRARTMTPLSTSVRQPIHFVIDLDLLNFVETLPLSIEELVEISAHDRTSQDSRQSSPSSTCLRQMMAASAVNCLHVARELLTAPLMLDVCHDGGGSSGERLQALYICHDGLLEPRGTSQAVPHVCSLADAGVRMMVLSFEGSTRQPDSGKAKELRARLESHGIEWIALRHHRGLRVAAVMLDLLSGIAAAFRLARTKRPRVVHGRGYVAGIMAWTVKLLFRSRLVFDMRGFWPEESVELGQFRTHGLLYRLSKGSERYLLNAADHVVVLTESAKAILRDREASARMATRRAVPETPITVIPCCTDLERFHPQRPDRNLLREHDLEGCVVIGNIGAVNKRYMLSEMFRLAFHVKSHRPETRFVYLTRHDDTSVRAEARRAGLRNEDLLVFGVEPEEVPRWLSLFRFGVFFLRPSYAAKGSSYAKLAEFLACGVPVVTNKGVGDIDDILGSNQCGLVVPGLRDSDLATAARQTLAFLDGDGVPQDVRDRCRATAARLFAIDEAARQYLAIYTGLAFPEQANTQTSVAVELD